MSRIPFCIGPSVQLLLTWICCGICTLVVTGGSDELCVVGCTPYVDPSRNEDGIEKYRALAREMANTCDIVVHVGDTKPGHSMGCNETTMTQAVHILAEEGARIVLYAPGDNELNDCHRHKSAPPGQRYPSEIAKAARARQFLIEDLNLTSGYDVTGKVQVHSHAMPGVDNPATCYGESGCMPYSCDFDKYIEMDDFSVATLEVIGSHWYLDVS